MNNKIKSYSVFLPNIYSLQKLKLQSSTSSSIFLLQYSEIIMKLKVLISFLIFCRKFQRRMKET